MFARGGQGDVVFVSSATGAVGSAVGQMAKLMGAARVIGSASTPKKATIFTEQFDRVAQQVGGWLSEGSIRSVDGLHNGVEAFLGLLVDKMGPAHRLSVSEPRLHSSAGLDR